MADGQEFGASAALSVRVDEGSLRQARREIEQELGSVQVGVDGGGGGTFAGSTLADGGGAGLGASAGGSLLATQRKQIGLLEDIHDELEKGNLAGGTGLTPGVGRGVTAVGGAGGGLGGLLGGLALSGGLTALFGNQAATATTGESIFQGGSLSEEGPTLGPLATLISRQAAGVDLGLGRLLGGGGSGSAGPEDTTQSTTQQGTPPTTVSVEDLVGIDEGDLTRDGGRGSSSGLTGAELRNILQQGLLPESAINQFVSAVETFSSRVGSRRTETVGGETVPASPVDPTGRGGQGQGAPRGRRGRLSPGPNATPTERSANRAAERQRNRSGDLTVNNDVTVPVENAVTERELQRELDRFERRLRRNLGGR